MSRTIHVAAAAFAALFIVGCSSDNAATPGTSGAAGSAGSGGTGSGSGGAGGSAGTDGGSNMLIGTFTVDMKHADVATMTAAFTTVSGTVYDGPTPPILPLVLDREEGGCQLLKPKPVFCAGGCGSTAVCAENNRCVPYPNPLNVGVVRVQGIGSAEVAMDPFPPRFAYQSEALPNPPCAEGTDVALSTDKFTARSKCVVPLELPSGDVSVRRNQPVKVAWNTPGRADVARVQLRLDVSHHGGKKGEIDCDVPDTGSFEIPAGLVTALVDLGLAGFPTIVVTRVAAASSGEQPGLTLLVSSSIEREVDTGVKSCSMDSECPPGQTCNKDNLTCG